MGRREHLWSLLLGLMLGMQVTAAPLVVYCAPEPIGSGEWNSGARAQPLCSIREAVKRAAANPEGGRVVLLGGRYPGEVQPAAEGAGPVVIEAENEGEAIIDGSVGGAQATAMPDAPGVYVLRGTWGFHTPEVFSLTPRRRFRNVAHVDTVRIVPGTCTLVDEETLAFHVPDQQTPAQADVRVAFRSYGFFITRSGMVMRGLRFEHFVAKATSSGIDLRAPDGVMERCQFFNCVVGAYLFDNVERAHVVNCTFEQCDTGIGCYGKDTLIAGNRLSKVHDNTVRDDTTGQNDTAILVYHPAVNATVRGNVTRGYGLGFEIKAPNSNTLVEHNTFLDSIGVSKESYTAMVIRRNIINADPTRLAAHPEDDPAGLARNSRFEHNLFFTRGDAASGALAKPIAATPGEGNLRGSPQFVDMENGNVRLKAGSPATALADEAGPAGALGVAEGDVPVTSVKWDISLADPATVLAGDTAAAEELMNGGDLRGRWEQIFTNQAAPRLYVVKGRQVRLLMRPMSGDLTAKPAAVRVAMGTENPRVIAANEEITLAESSELQRLEIEVDGSKATFGVVSAAESAKVVGRPELRLTQTGAVVTFATDVPASSELVLEAGEIKVTGRQDLVHAGDPEPGAGHSAGKPLWTRQHAVRLPVEKLDLTKPVKVRVLLTDLLGRKSTRIATLTDTKAQAARTLHVSTDGRDEVGRGSVEQPLGTVQYAVDQALPGDTVHLRPGVYFQSAVVYAGGTAEAPLTITGDDAGTTVMDGLRLTENLLLVDAAAHVRVRNLGFRWYKGSAVETRNAADFHLENCRIINHGWGGYATGNGLRSYGSPRAVVTGNIICRTENALWFHMSPGPRIEHNTLAANVFSGIALLNSLRNAVVRSNAICFSGSYPLRIIERGETEARLRERFATTTFDFNNYPTDVRTAHLEKNGGKSVAPPSNQSYFPTEAKCVFLVDAAKEYWINDIEQWRALTGQDAHSLFAEPQFEDPWRGCWSVAPSSPHIGAGMDGSTIGAP